MSDVSHAVDSKTAQRLRARRIVVVDAERSRGDAIARALEQSGALTATVTPQDDDYELAHELDADVLLVNEDESQACRALVLELRVNPRTRWSTVLPVSFAALWPAGAAQPDLTLIADRVNDFVTPLVELTVRAKGKLPHEAPLEPLGPSRSLRALASTDRGLRITFADARVRAELELSEGNICGVRLWVTGDDAPALVDGDALAVLLAMSSGQVHIDERIDPLLKTWNVALTEALEIAAATTAEAIRALEPNAELARQSQGLPVPARVLSEILAAQSAQQAGERGLQPTVPQLKFADVLADACARGRDIRGLPPPPDLSRDAEPTRAVETHALATAATASDEASVPAIDRQVMPTLAPSRSRTPALALALALVAAGTLALVLHGESALLGALGGDERTATYGSSLATAFAQAEAEEPAEPPVVAQVRSPEPVAPIAPPPVEAAPEPVVAPPAPSPAELAQAKRIAKRAHRYLRDKRYATAALAFSKVLALDPSHAIAMRALVRIHLRERNAAEALQWAERLVQLEPDSGVSQQLLGDARALAGGAADKP